MEPEITNERAAREWQWLCDEVGEIAVRGHIAKVAGRRRAYPLNIARALGVKLPPEDRLPPLRKLASEQELDDVFLRLRSLLKSD